MKKNIWMLAALTFSQICWCQNKKDVPPNPKGPTMGWSSWNSFRVNIDEKLIKEQADALIASGLYDAGYRYINIDDGFFGGRDTNGKLVVNPAKFPSGMKRLVAYIHSKGLKAGIYSDGGENTCGSMWDNDKNGIGVGLYGHADQDADFYFKECGFDFIKVDWCGGEKLKLQPQNVYPDLIARIKAVNLDVVFNICTWKFPGTWAVHIANSWRVSEDIRADFNSVLHIIDIDKNLKQYTSAGHYNDMDMLQVGRGMSYEEDKSHFSMWCMLNSPLLAGNDLRNMSKETIGILTNKELIALNQDTAFKQAAMVLSDRNVEVWEKPLAGKKNSNKAIALFNRGENTVDYTLVSSKINIATKAKARDLWQPADIGKIGEERTFTIPRHGIVVLKIEE